jgi:hypothetical protein
MSSKTPNGFSVINHVIGVYHQNITDGDHTQNQIFNQENLHLAYGDNVKFHQICKGNILLPPQKKFNSTDTSREDYNFES